MSDEHKTLSADDLAFFRAMVTAHEWQFAKTMPKTPHWYTLRRKWASDADFVRFASLTREFGYDDPYRGKMFRAINVDGFKYWTMGAPLDKTILVNRKPVPAKDADK